MNTERLPYVLLATIVIAVAIYLATGCGAAQKPVEDLSQFVSVSEPILRAAYEAEQTACLDQPDKAACVTAVRARWAPVRDVMEQIEKFWCDAKPEVCK